MIQMFFSNFILLLYHQWIRIITIIVYNINKKIYRKGTNTMYQCSKYNEHLNATARKIKELRNTFMSPLMYNFLRKEVILCNFQMQQENELTNC